MAEIGKDEIPVMGLDANAQLGTAGRLGEGGRKGGVLGSWGLRRGRAMVGFFGHLLISPSLRTINLVPAHKLPDLEEFALAIHIYIYLYIYIFIYIFIYIYLYMYV